MGTFPRPIRSLLLAAAIAFSITLPWHSSRAVTVVVDFSHDDSGLFALIPEATAAAQAAAADLSHFITTSLTGFGTNSFTGTQGSTDATFTFNYTFSNPTTGAPLTHNPGLLTPDEVRIFAGFRVLAGSTAGQGGPGGATLDATGSGFESQWVAAVAAAEHATNDATQRGGEGPIINSFNGDLTLGATTAFYSIAYTSGVGNIWLDSDTDNSGSPNSVAELEAFWHFDHTTAVAVGKLDFYSVALHEMIHALGFGTSQSWDALASGTDWSEPAVNSLLGTGTGVLNPDGVHAADAILTLNPFGTQQQAVMTSAITVGERRYLTELDLAFLSDIGWSVAPIPEPTTGLLLLCGVAVLVGSRRRVG